MCLICAFNRELLENRQDTLTQKKELLILMSLGREDDQAGWGKLEEDLLCIPHFTALNFLVILLLWLNEKRNQKEISVGDSISPFRNLTSYIVYFKSLARQLLTQKPPPHLLKNINIVALRQGKFPW